MKKLITALLFLSMCSCYSAKDKFDYLQQQYPNSDVLSCEGYYYVVDTSSMHGAIYKISFYYGTHIASIDRLR